MEPEDLSRLFAAHAQGLYAMFAYRTGDRMLAEDLVADTFERALTARRRFDPLRGNERSWIYAIGVNLLRDHARRAAVEQRSLERVGAAVATSGGWMLDDALGQRDELEQAMARLADEEREVLALRFGADLTLKEIAKALGERQAAVEKRLYRALAKLREKLE